MVVAAAVTTRCLNAAPPPHQISTCQCDELYNNEGVRDGWQHLRLSAKWISITSRWGIYITSLLCISVFAVISPSASLVFFFPLSLLCLPSFLLYPSLPLLSSPSVDVSLHFVKQITPSICHLFSPFPPSRSLPHQLPAFPADPASVFVGCGLMLTQCKFFSVAVWARSRSLVSATPSSQQIQRMCHRQHKGSVVNFQAHTVSWLHIYRVLAYSYNDL